jgi:DNA ligase-1
MIKVQKPMKGEDFVESELKFPYLASTKLDGYRAFVEGGVLRTSSGAPVTNHFTQSLFGQPEYEGLDGELIVGAWNDPNAYKNTSGPVRKASGEPNVRWYVFDDRTSPGHHFEARIATATSRVIQAHMRRGPSSRIDAIPHTMVRDRKALEVFEKYAIEAGFEGVMLRDPQGRYKFGRATLKENLLLKVKRFVNEEATIIGKTEQMRNVSESVENDVGAKIKSESKENLEPTGMIGSLIVRSAKWGCDFELQTSSMTHAERKEAFEQFDTLYKGQIARFRYFPHGVVDRPRHAMFEAIRGKEDMTE